MLLSQTVFDPPGETGYLYSFLDELASLKIISINTAVKPYSRQNIGTYLDTAFGHIHQLNPRQQKDLEFFRRAFQADLQGKREDRFILPLSSSGNADHHLTYLSWDPAALVYSDTFLRFVLRPVLGGEIYAGAGKKLIDRKWGLAMHAYMGKHWALYASLIDNSLTDLLSKPTYLNTFPGGNYKLHNSGGDYSEMRGGMTYSWKWGYIGLVKDHFTWGNSAGRSIILSDRAPSYPQFRLCLKPAFWLELNYFHASLVSEIVDSTRSYYTSQGTYRSVFRNKFMAANFITLTPLKTFAFSFGNSIIYSDIDIQHVFFIPVLFFKSVDHTINHTIENENSQMFLDVSYRPLKHLHIYGSLFLDELKVSRIFNPDEHNFTAAKIGLQFSNWPIENLIVTSEFTHVNPIVYQHRVPSLTYASNKYNLGFYLGDNSREWYNEVTFKPVSKLIISASFTYAIKGNVYNYTNGNEAVLYPIMKDITWKNNQIHLAARYFPLTSLQFTMNLYYNNITTYNVDGKSADYYNSLFTPEFFRKNRWVLSGGFLIGF